MHICAVVVDPAFSGSGLFRYGFCFKEKHFCLYTIRIENTCRPAQGCVQVGGFKKFFKFDLGSFEIDDIRVICIKKVLNGLSDSFSISLSS